MHPPRYTLQPYAGKKTRYTCPGCGQPHKFTRYLDTQTGELLPEQFGRCDREAKCGWHRNPYDKGASGQSYADELRQNQPATTDWRYCKPAPPPPAPLGIIPEEVVQQSLGSYHRNTFARMLCRLFGGGEADELLSRFEVGTSGYWPGATIFWQRDELGRARGAQVALFDEEGHTIKQPQPDGSTRRATSWIHKALERSHQQRNQPIPKWLGQYLRPEVSKSPSLYGLRQLDAAPPDKPCGIVEAPKTAILCTPYLPDCMWLAVGSLSNLTAERLRPVKSRPIILYPDTSENGRAYGLWATKAAELRGQGFNVKVSDWLEKEATTEQKAKGYDLADVILENHKGYPPSWDATA